MPDLVPGKSYARFLVLFFAVGLSRAWQIQGLDLRCLLAESLGV